MSYKVNNGSTFSGLTLADNQFSRIEEIHQYNARLKHDRGALGTRPLTDSDYFAALPTESTELLHQKRLHAMVEQAKRKQIENDIAAEDARKEAAKVSF